MKKYLVLVYIVISLSASGQNFSVYPTHWFTGFKNNKLQLIVHADENIAVDKLVFRSSSKDVKVTKVFKPENRHYLFVDLEISPAAKPQTVKFSFGGVVLNEWKTFNYEIKSRSKENGMSRVQGVTSKDLVYLLMPDRFCNADVSNDYFNDMRDTGHDRNNPFDRHGGDLAGVESKLDYLKDLGVTSLWMTPVVENDMSRTMESGTSRSTYHGYAFTNQYEVDRRLGGNDSYKKLIKTAHAKGIKIIQDAVYNHVGNDHWSARDLPMKDWLNNWPTYTNTSYKDQPIPDPYSSAIDKKTSIEGWFTPFLVDLNQKNPYVSNFLIQYAIWATEEFGIDGWRVDTYFYSEPSFLNKVNDALAKEFPAVTVFGESWVMSPSNSAYFTENNLNVPFKHNCPGVTDFPFYFSLVSLLNEPYGWNEGANKFYQVLAQDYLYKNPFRNCIFLGNHDLDRSYSVLGENDMKYKMAMNILLTQRGIPQLYYGEELAMKNFKNPTDAEVRKDFPGGWLGDPVDKFTAAGRTVQENEIFNYIKALANFRKGSTALGTGKLMQYLPKDGVYTYFRYDTKQTVMIISNTGSVNFKPDWSYLSERTTGYSKLKNVITGAIVEMSSFEIKPKESYVFELIR